MSEWKYESDYTRPQKYLKTIYILKKHKMGGKMEDNFSRNEEDEFLEEIDELNLDD
ncbi:hypothetical protein KAT24_02210 [Candidatus Pacearchaeota archaeon]|nr:hypothetical protein [Candidatus Pacearchaeota archaeon]